MWPYWFLFLFPAWMAVLRIRSGQGQSIGWPGSWQLVFVALVLMIGLRHEVGGDWYNDWRMITGVNGPGASVSLAYALSKSDVAYSLLIWLVNEVGMDVYALDVLSAVPFVWGLIIFCRAQPRPWLALVVAVPYLVIVVAMGYTRQSVAIGFSMLGLVALSKGNILRFVLWLSLAALFHKSAVILLPLALLADSRRKLVMTIWVCVATFVMYVLALQEAVDGLVKNYIGIQYASEGAGIRIAMNAMPAFFFLWFRRRFAMTRSDSNFWAWMSCGALVFVVLLWLSPSSTAVDRVALYWIPLQLFVLSRLPDAMASKGRNSNIWVYAVIAYSATVQFVWLFFAQTAFAWLPYQFYPWVWLWK
jgi:hypothetical protein